MRALTGILFFVATAVFGQRIERAALLGTWENKAAPLDVLDFCIRHGELNMHTSVGLTYYFSTDSLPQVYFSGYSPNWPPFGCELRLMSPTDLEVTYEQLGVQKQVLYYKKREALEEK